ncbi:Roundabout 2 [Schistosoma japonicum]|uniref:Roundabout 2 n=1 Tax=Schistosoma japonicum TaxID=6182 RepID=A0A4Z2D8U5_SCHJA|nr:Roundabout 2 [Schistosoma japonicum]
MEIMRTFIIQCLLLIIHFSTGLTVYRNDVNQKINFTKPIITHSPSDVFSTDGVIEFTCQASGYPKPTVIWYDALTGQRVIDDLPSSGTTSGIHVNQHYGKLLISSPERGKLYSFYCNASNSAGWTISQPPVRGGSVYISSQFQQIPVDKTVHEGDKVVMECTPPIGIPEVKVYWLKNNNLLAAQNGVKLRNNLSVMNELNPSIEISIDGSLHIYPVSIKDAGIYTCVASNVAGEQVSPSANLVVKSRTRFLETPVDVKVKKGRDVKLKCKVEGNYVVKWKRGPGEEPIDPNRAELTESYLLIRNVQITDAGTYICTAPGGIEADATVTVDTPPAFSVTPDDLTINEGETAIFHCIAAGHPMPAIYWELPDKTPIFPGDQTINGFHDGKHYLTPEGSLEVRDVRQRDSGKYQCTAHSSIDTIHTSATLHVNKKKIDSPKDTYSLSANEANHLSLSNYYWLAPIIGLPPANQTRTIGELVTLDCELGLTRDISGSLSSISYSDLSDWSIGWHKSTKDGVKRNIDASSFPYDGRYTLLPRGSLQITNAQVEDSGNYTCFATAIIRPYLEGSLVSFTLQSNWTSYLDIVPQGSHLTKFIDKENPLPPPENLKATNVTSSTVILVWDPSLPSVYPLELVHENLKSPQQISYWVELYRPDRPTDGWIVVEKNWHANTVQLGGLQPDTAYYFLIRPRWNQGRVGWASAPLGPILTLREEYSSLQEGQVSDKETLQSFKEIDLVLLHLYPLSPKRVRVSWSVTEVPLILSLVASYTIYHREVPIMQCILNKLDGVHSDSGKSTSNNGERMYCSIKSTTDVDSHALFRLETMQALQENLKSKQEFNNVTSNSWTITNIKSQYTKDGKYNEIHHSLTYQESGILRDLEAFRCYEVKVKAHSSTSTTKSVESRESNSMKVLTYESFPSSPPERIFAVWISNTTIELSWDPPPVVNWNGLLIGYIIYVYDEDASNHQNFNLSYTEQKTLIKGLTRKTTYFVQMAGVTCKGIGVRSTPIQLKPDLRKKGLGVGWGFDLQTGKLIQLMNSERKDNTNVEDLINQPWLIVTIICSLLVWCATVTLITFCCRHQRHRFKKSAGTVLIANNSQCGSVADGSNNICTSINNSMNENKSSKNLHLSQKDHVQMEPLLRSETPNMENDNCLETVEKGKYSGWCQYPTTNQNHSLYNATCNPHDDFTNKDTYDPQFNSFNPSMLPLSLSQRLPNESNNVGLYATAESITNTLVNNNHINIQSNHTQPSHLVFQLPTSLVRIPNGCTSRSSYLNYQSHAIPQSLMNTNLPNGYNNTDLSFSPVTRIGLTGLPLVAPVAPIESIQHVNDSILSSHSLHGCNGPVQPMTVAPYATASLIHNTANTNNSHTKNCISQTFYALNNGIYDGNCDTPSELTYEFDDHLTPPHPISPCNKTNINSEYPNCNFSQIHSQTSQSSFTNYINGIYRTSKMSNGENEMKSQFPSLGQHDVTEILQRQDIRNKSNSATSSSLTNDDERSYKWMKNTTDILPNESSVNFSTSTSGNLPITSHFKQNNSKITATTPPSSQHQNTFTPKSEKSEMNLFTYDNKQLIPPPPKSPPPPAPKYNFNIHDNDNIMNYQCSPKKNDEHHEIPVEYSSSSSLSSQSHHLHSTASIVNDKIQTPQSYPILVTNMHDDKEYIFNTNYHNNSNNVQCSQLNNTKSSINKQDIYYSNFCSSDDERENDEIIDRKQEHENVNNTTKNINDNFRQTINHQQQYHHQNHSVNSSFCVDKQGYIQRPVMVLNEHEITNSPQTSFCITLSPEEHSSSTYAQVY